MLKVFAVLDNVAGAYMNPFVMNTKSEAFRAFGDAITDEKSTLAKHPDDYALYELAEFDQESGYIKSHDIPSFVCRAADFKKS